MSQTKSEHIVTRINSNIFFEEFTFHKNDFYPKDGKKELADNILLLDDLFFVIQIKERNKNKSTENIEKWFTNKVLKKAKEQIKNTLEYLNKYDKIPITNAKNQTIDIANTKTENIKKLILYKVEEDLDTNEKNVKFYESQKCGLIHILNIKDYHWICKYLVTPSELDEYLSFRERIYLKHKSLITIYPEQYMLGHFLNTDNENIINEKYIESLTKLKSDLDGFDLSKFLKVFSEKLIPFRQKKSLDYHSVIKEIARLKRYELLEFKNRFIQIIGKAESQEMMLPYRFRAPTTGCGFVFVAIPSSFSNYWENTIRNMSETFKYKWKLKKCLGVIIHKKESSFEINWAYSNYDWKYDKELEQMVEKEKKFINPPEFKPLTRYKFVK